MDIDRADPIDELVHYRPRARSGTRRGGVAGSGADHQLRRLLDPGEGCQRLSDVVADDLAIHAAEADQQAALTLEVATRSLSRADDVHTHEVSTCSPGDARRAPNEMVAALTAESDDDSFANAAGLVGIVGKLPLQLFLYAIGDPQQAQLAQLAEDLGAEHVGERGVDAIRWVHVPVGEAAT